MKNRIWEIDFFRGIALIMMIMFHLIYDLKEFYSYDFEYLEGFWYYEGLVSVVIFTLISGISATLAHNNFKRGLSVFGYGMFLTVVTYFYAPKMYIRFGTLHMLGFCMMAYNYLDELKKRYLLAISITTIAAGNIFATMTVKSPYLYPLGLLNSGFSSLDYYPILPWFGVFLLGVILGKTIYHRKKSLFGFNPKFEPISYMGRHSLFIYFTHQLVILALLYIYHRL